jgi:hypothetical protein
MPMCEEEEGGNGEEAWLCNELGAMGARMGGYQHPPGTSALFIYSWRPLNFIRSFIQGSLELVRSSLIYYTP